MLAPQWTWWACVPILLVAFAVLYLPGAAALAALRLRLWTVVAATPLVTVTLVGAGGLLAWAVHLPWTPLTFVALALALVAGAFAAGRRWSGPGLLPTRLDAHRAGAVLLAGLIIGRTIQTAAIKPGNFPQNPDMIFHLDLTRWFVEHASASSLDASLGVASPVQFYPAALHGIAATVGMITGAPPIITLTCVELLFVCLAWPAALIALLAALGRATCRTTWLAGILAAALPVFPYRLIGYGPLWPFDAGLALAPVWLALLVEAAHPGDERLVGKRALVLAAITLPGMALLHAGVALTLLIPTWYLGNEWALAPDNARLLGRLRHPLRLLAALWLPAFVALGSVAAPEGMRTVTDALPVGWGQALGEGARLWGGGTDATLAAAVVLLVVMLIGAGLAVWRGTWWIAATALTTAVLALLLHAFGTDWARWLFWPWQNVVERLRVVTGMFGIVLAVLGLEALADVLRHRAGRPRGTEPGVGRPSARWTPLVPFVLCLALATWCTWVSAATSRVTLGNYYRGAARIPWLTSTEADALRAISQALPDDAVVVADPYNGGTFLAVVGPEQLLLPTEKTNDDDRTLITASLDKAGSDPAVCAALARHHADYVMVGGDPASPTRQGKNYTALDRAALQPGFVRVAQAKPYTVYRIDACRR